MERFLRRVPARPGVLVPMAIALLALAAHPTAVHAQRDLSPKYLDPITNYDEVEIDGWSFLVNKRLKEHPEIRKEALETFRWQLWTIERVVPPHAVAVMKKVTIWLEYKCVAAAQYHPGRDWLVKNGYHPEKTRCIDVGDVTRYIGDRRSRAVMVLLHELVHAWHDQGPGFDDPRIIAAFERAKASGLYDEVLHDRRAKVRHYALANHKEWFAEISECYLWVNDYFPFNAAELKKLDPAAHRVMQDVWRKPTKKSADGKETDPDKKSDIDKKSDTDNKSDAEDANG